MIKLHKRRVLLLVTGIYIIIILVAYLPIVIAGVLMPWDGAMGTKMFLATQPLILASSFELTYLIINTD